MIGLKIECAALQITLANTTDKHVCLSDCMIREMGDLSLSGQLGFPLCKSIGSFHTKQVRIFKIQS